MSLLGPASPRQLAIGIAIVRVVAGVILLAHGWQKVFVFGFGGVTGAFTQMGVPMPSITGPLIAVLELAGGAALILGLFTRLAALGLAADMLGAIFLVHLENGFFLPNGIEFVLMLFAACTALVIAGAGALSIDEAIATRRTAATGDPYARRT